METLLSLLSAAVGQGERRPRQIGVDSVELIHRPHETGLKAL